MTLSKSFNLLSLYFLTLKVWITIVSRVVVRIIRANTCTADNTVQDGVLYDH